MSKKEAVIRYYFLWIIELVTSEVSFINSNTMPKATKIWSGLILQNDGCQNIKSSFGAWKKYKESTVKIPVTQWVRPLLAKGSA